MKLKTFGLAALAAAVMMFVAAGTASATIIESGSGTQYKTGTSLTAASEGTTEFHPPIGSINCKKSHFGGKTSNDGGAGVRVNANMEAFSFSECNAHVTVKATGTTSIEWNGGNGLIFSVGLQITIVFQQFHCEFKTNNTKIGTLTIPSRKFHVEATLPRVGGTSGAFCGSTAQWTGSYIFTNPSSLAITGP